jgi:hypothetical protein
MTNQYFLYVQGRCFFRLIDHQIPILPITLLTIKNDYLYFFLAGVRTDAGKDTCKGKYVGQRAG